MGQLELTAFKSNQFSGWATITHPFHPLKGQRFKILSGKTFNNRDIFNLQASPHETNTIAIPREWTDRGEPNPYQDDAIDSAPILSFLHLQQLAELINVLTPHTADAENN